MSTTTVEPVSGRPETRLSLHIHQEKEGQVDSTTLVRWSVSQEFLDDLEERKFSRPYLILVVRSFVHETREGEEYIYPRQDSMYAEPLEAEARYITFKRPGDNEIRAFIVNAPSRKDRRLLWNLERDDHLRSIFVLVPEESYDEPEDKQEEEYIPDPSRFGRLSHVRLGIRLPVKVPNEMFAKTYPQWIQKIVRRFFPERDRDQCHFRKRALLCIPILIFMFTIGTVVRLVCMAVGLVIGARGDHLWRNAIKPIQGSIFGPLYEVESSFWFWDKKKDDVRGANPMWIINPIVLFVPASIVFAFQQLWAHHHGKHSNGLLSYPGYWSTVLMVDLAIVALVIAIVLLALFCMGAIKFGESSVVLNKVVKKLKSLSEGWSASLKARNQRKLAELVRQVTDESTSYEAIPKNMRTIQLRWQRTKAKVCRPFAQ